MKIRIVAFGIAKEIIGSKKMEIETEENVTIAGLKNQLFAQYPAFKKLTSLQFAVLESYQDASFELSANDEVVLIPPVSGG